MKRAVSHDEALAALDAAALDALDASERQAVLAHAAGCPECARELLERRETLADLALAAPLSPSDASRDRIRSRLMARAAADKQVDMAPVTPAPTATAMFRAVNALAWRRGEWVAAAASVLLVASVGALAWLARDRETLRDVVRSQTTQVAVARASSDSLRSAIASRDSLIAGITGHDVAVMRLTAAGTKAPYAYMFWDRPRNAWTLVAHNMPALKTGRTYQLWLVKATGEKVSAGTFDPQNGDAVVRATYAITPAQLKALAVTEEAAGGAAQPTTQPIIVAVNGGS